MKGCGHPIVLDEITLESAFGCLCDMQTGKNFSAFELCLLILEHWYFIQKHLVAHISKPSDYAILTSNFNIFSRQKCDKILLLFLGNKLTQLVFSEKNNFCC